MLTLPKFTLLVLELSTCKVVRLKLEKIAEADIMSAYGEFVMYPERDFRPGLRRDDPLAGIHRWL